MAATNLEVARKARRGQFALVGGFCAVVLFGSVFSQTQRALLDAVLAPPAAFAAMAVASDSRVLAPDVDGAFPRPTGFAARQGWRQPAAPVRGQEVATAGVGGPIQGAAAGVPDAVSDVPPPADVAATLEASGGASGNPVFASIAGSPGFPASASFSAPGGGSAGAPGIATTLPTDTGTPPATQNPTQPAEAVTPTTIQNPNPPADPVIPPAIQNPGTPADPVIPPTARNPNPPTDPVIPPTARNPDPPTDPAIPQPPGRPPAEAGTPSPVPEPATWATLISGFFLIGWAMRRRRRRAFGTTSLS